jgi:hypothetical protein
VLCYIYGRLGVEFIAFKKLMKQGLQSSASVTSRIKKQYGATGHRREYASIPLGCGCQDSWGRSEDMERVRYTWLMIIGFKTPHVR